VNSREGQTERERRRRRRDGAKAPRGRCADEACLQNVGYGHSYDVTDEGDWELVAETRCKVAAGGAAIPTRPPVYSPRKANMGGGGCARVTLPPAAAR
jgi:hypothetical protein